MHSISHHTLTSKTQGEIGTHDFPYVWWHVEGPVLYRSCAYGHSFDREFCTYVKYEMEFYSTIKTIKLWNIQENKGISGLSNVHILYRLKCIFGSFFRFKENVALSCRERSY